MIEDSVDSVDFGPYPYQQDYRYGLHSIWEAGQDIYHYLSRTMLLMLTLLSHIIEDLIGTYGDNGWIIVDILAG